MSTTAERLNHLRALLGDTQKLAAALGQHSNAAFSGNDPIALDRLAISAGALAAAAELVAERAQETAADILDDD